MEINIKEPAVPDFSQTFVKGATHNFSLLLSDFMKKPSRYFAGKKATGFIKYRSKILISNTETLMLTDPEPMQGGYRLKWASDMGKTGTCTMTIAADGTLWFTGLGTFDKSIGPDKLVFVRQPGQTAARTYLAAGTRRRHACRRQARYRTDRQRPEGRRDIGISRGQRADHTAHRRPTGI